MLFVTQQMSVMFLLAVLKILSFNGSGGSPSGVNARDELNDERVCYRSLPEGGRVKSVNPS